MLSSSLTKYWICSFFATLVLSVVAGQGAANGLSISPRDQVYESYLNQTYHVICLSPRTGVSTSWTGPSGQKVSPAKGRIHTEERSGAVNGVALLFESIEKRDKGEYTCSSIVDGKEVKINFKLIVIKPISFLDTPAIQNASENQNTLVRCEVEGDPMPTVLWHVKGAKLNGSNSKYNIVADGLIIKNVTLNDRGEYQCRALQMSQMNSKIVDQKITLRIQHKPMWQTENRTVDAYGYLTGVVNLTCDAVADPPATYEWFKGDKTVVPRTNITIHKEVGTSTLQLVVHNTSVFADYSCKAKNPLGTTKRTFKLREGTKPSPPASASISHINAAWVELTIKGPTDKSDTLGYRAQYILARQNENEKNWNLAQAVNLEKGAFYVVSPLDPNTNYIVRVASRGAAGVSDYSSPLAFKTLQQSNTATVADNSGVHHTATNVIALVLASVLVARL